MSRGPGSVDPPAPPAAGAGAAADDRRRAAGALVLGVYRLIKACLLHSDSNQVVLALVPATADAIVEICALSGAESVTVSFGGETVFVNGHMLRTAREAYDVARELGGFFEVCGVNLLILDRGVRRAELASFARLLADAQRDKGAGERVARSELRGIRVRNVPRPAAISVAEERSVAARASRAYAASILVVRALHAGLKAGETALPRRVLRVAQRLVSLAEEDLRLLLSLATARTAEPDEAAPLVSAAILALGMARQLTSDRRTLAALVSAGLLAGAGRPRLTGGARPEGRAHAAAGRAGRLPLGLTPLITRSLNEDDRERLPASAAVALTALGRLHPPAVARTAIVYEALALRAGPRRGPVYGGRRPPTLLSRILAVAQAFAELRAAPLAGVAGVQDATIDGVIQQLAERADGVADRTLVKLLVGALGFFPSATFVELSTGELAVVTVAGGAPPLFARPRVRVLCDARGSLLPAPFDVDLASPPAAGLARSIARQIEPEAHQLAAVRAVVASTAAARPPPPPSLAAANGVMPRGAGAATEAPPPPPRRGERVRTAPAPITSDGSHTPPPTPIAAAWLGRPLSPSGLHAIIPPPHSAPPLSAPPLSGSPRSGAQRSAAQGSAPQGSAPPRRPPPIDRATLLEKLQSTHLPSTQPPPPDGLAPPAVPPPPRLPRESTHPGQAPPAAARPPDRRSASPSRRPDPRQEPDAEETWTDLNTIEPPPWIRPPPDEELVPWANLPPAPIDEASNDPAEEWPDLDDLRMIDGSVAPLPAPDRASEGRSRAGGRRFDPRIEPEDETWDHLPPPTPDPPTARPTLEPPTLEPPTLEPLTLEPPTLEPPTLAPRTEPMLEPTFEPFALEPTIDPPISEPFLERDRLLAAYLAERTPAPSSRFPAPSSHLLGDAARRGARPSIPREEPAEEALEPSPPTDREGPL